MICNFTTITAIGLSILINLPLVTTRHDVPEKQYEDLAADFPAVGSVVKFGTGTLVAKQWVLTAAHIPEFFHAIAPDKDKRSFIINGKTYKIIDVVYPPNRQELKVVRGEPVNGNDHDLALLKLGEPVLDVEPAAIYRGDEEVGQEFTLVGCGGFWGDGRKGATMRQGMTIPRGPKRAGTNRFESLTMKDHALRATFNAPGSSAVTEFEVGVFGGDSGGPLLVQADKQWVIAGVASMGETGDDDLLGNYGDVIIATRIAKYAKWIDDTIATIK